MLCPDEVFLLRKEKIGWVAVIGWVLALWFGQYNAAVRQCPVFVLAEPGFWAVIAWLATTFWVTMDSSYRKMSAFGWTALWVITAPIGLSIYFLARRPMPAICYRCGCGLNSTGAQCQNCGYQSYIGRLRDFFRSAYAGGLDSLSKAPVESSRKTVAYAAAACGVFAFLGIARLGVGEALAPLAAAAYWVLVAYWVYLDSKWRRMEPLPWTALALLTNLVGLATYLVIRQPEPATCSQCRAPLNAGLKHCPYCGAATESVCPRCQAQVQPGWIFCPACAAQLPSETLRESSNRMPSPRPSTVSIRGCVTDAELGISLAGVKVTIDSKTIKASAATDPVGRYMLVDLAPRPYVLIACAEGYIPQTRQFEPNATKSEPVNFSLKKKPA